MLRVGLIGFGAIGKDVVRYIQQNKAGDVQLKGILVRNKRKYPGEFAPYLYECEDDFFSLGLDVVIESAGHQAVRDYCFKAFEAGCDFITVSVGAFADEELLARMESAAKEYQQQLILPSAAIAGLDRIAAAALQSIEDVTLITRKPLQAWKGTIAEDIVNLNELEAPALIYKGTAREAAKMFPESTNVSAALSIAGVGFERTTVEVYADPSISNNTHQIVANGFFGKVSFEIENTPSADNPKTGYIVAMSICKVLRNLSSPIVIGV